MTGDRTARYPEVVIPGSGMRSAHRALSTLVLALFVAGCGASPTPAPPGPGGSPTPAVATPLATTPAQSDEPTAEPTAEPSTAEPTDAITPEPSPTGSGEPSAVPTSAATTSPTAGAGRCSGSAENREFFAAVARAVEWAVYCPVLPSGWYVDTGSFRLSGGAKLEISYKGPVGQRLEIREGAYCTTADCTPDGTDLGGASIDGRAAHIFDLGNSTVAVYAAGNGVAWEAKGLGMDNSTLGSFTADFVVVGR